MYYPTGVTPIHEVKQWAKVRSIARAIEAGKDLPPILLFGSSLLTGTHRWVANELLARRGKTETRIEAMQLISLPSDVQKIIIDLYMEPDMYLVQEVFEDYLYANGHRYDHDGWRDLN